MPLRRARTAPGRLRTALVALAGLVAVVLALVSGCQSVAGSQAAQEARRAANAMPAPTATATGEARQGCERSTRTKCYTFEQLRRAYGTRQLNEEGTDGAGRTVAALNVGGSPHLAEDLRGFSSALELPQANLKVVRQSPGAGRRAAAFDPHSENMVAMAREATMDVQALHAMAPRADLLFYQVDLERADAERGITPRAMDLLAQGIRTVVERHKVDVLSLSFVFPETGDQTAHVARIQRELRPVFEEAARKGVTIVAGSGDEGAAPGAVDALAAGEAPQRTVSWPASDPGVTAVGGTRLTLDDQGRRRSPDTVWDDSAGATGGGTSVLAGRPAYQDDVRDTTGEHRGVPDVSLTASATGSTMIWFTLGSRPLWVPMLGTSLAAPLFGGITALAAQRAGKGLGAINATLYAKGTPGITDVVTGANGEDGYRATRGYDLASGLGTVDAKKLVPALAKPPGLRPEPRSSNAGGA